MKHSLEVLRDKMVHNAERKKALKIARNLKAKGSMDVNEIAEVTGLTVDDVLRL
jgi:predicted transcriptional regulator